MSYYVLNFVEYKDYLTKNFQKYGDIGHYRDGTSEIVTYKPEDVGNLYHQTLLIPDTQILHTERWGWHREGSNGNSSDVDIALLQKKTSEIKKVLKIK